MGTPELQRTPLAGLHNSEANLPLGPRRDASDATIEAEAVVAAATQRPDIVIPRVEVRGGGGGGGGGDEYVAPTYASDSIGRLSVTSSGYQSSDFGHGGARSGSEADWQQQQPQLVQRGGAYDSGQRRKAKKVAPPELLVIVRPPPSKQSNPLNLQIQLVIPLPPSSREPAGQPRTSGESSRDEVSMTASTSSSTSLRGGLRRSNSMSSETSSGGFSTYSTSSSGVSSSRKVTPLYNLCFHSILPTTVTDAGTDDKVAKFGRKGVEIDGFGHLEPHELVYGVNDLATLDKTGRRGSRSGPVTATSVANSGSGSGVGSPGDGSVDSHMLSRRSEDEQTSPPTSEEPPTSFEAMTPEAKAPPETVGGKLLSKFKRFSTQARPDVSGGVFAKPSSANDGQSLFGRLSVGSGVRGVSSAKESLAPSVTSGTDRETATSTRDSISGLTNTFTHTLGLDIPQLVVGGGLKGDSSKRTEGYYWTVRKWTRKAEFDEDENPEASMRRRSEAGSNAILSSVWKRFNIVNRMGGNEIHPPPTEIPVRIEWTRDPSATRRASSRRRSVAAHARSATDSVKDDRRGSSDVSVFRRGSVLSQRSSSAAADSSSNLRPPKKTGSRPPSVGTSSPRQSTDAGSNAPRISISNDGNSGDDDDDPESDPEDSETPWTCHLVLGPTTRIPIGSLSPAPHHPKLVGQLAIPFPLPDLSASSLGADGAGLTREEIKDIISVTCLFVVVREGFGGLGSTAVGGNAASGTSAKHRRAASSIKG